jgi:YwiC-like protein
VSAATSSRARHAWMPHQHGAWAMLAVPLLIGVAASRPAPGHLLLAATAVAGYLASTTGQAWLRARRREALTLPLAVYLAALAVLGLGLVIAWPALLAGTLILVPTTAVVVAGARPGTRRDLANSLAQAAQALVLVPSAAVVAGSFEPARAAVATLVAAAYLASTVLVVRSMLRERDSAAFARVSTGYHLLLIVGGILVGPAWAMLAAGLAVRAAALPVIGRRRAAGGRALRPVHVGLVELVAAVAVVLVAFLAAP